MSEPSPDSTVGGQVTAVVLCGGQARRFGRDKTRAELDGRPLLDHLLDGLPPEWPVLCVGPMRPTSRPVDWTREEPPGGGPVAALAAALPQVRTPVLVLLAADMPHAGPVTPQLVTALLADAAGASHQPEAVAARDPGGRVQPLLAAYRRAALEGALPQPAAGSPLMRLLDSLRFETVLVGTTAARDVDTPRDLEQARHRVEP
jgi:molybdenum cofactor guanylyltransferase